MKRSHPEAYRVEVEWVDSVHHSGWKDYDLVIEDRKTMANCVSVGLLIKRDKLGVTLAGSAHDGELAGVMHIPKGAIRKVRRLR